MRLIPAAVPALAAALAALACACSDATTPACRVGADCASGVCNGDGSCAPLPDAGDATVTADADASLDDSGDAVATSHDAADANTSDLGADVADDSDGGPRVCTPVDDDRISADELPLRPGLYATFAIAQDVIVDTGGHVADGVRTWDLTGPYAGDSNVRVDLEPVTGAWWATDFAGATYAAQLSVAEDYRGVFEVKGDALVLRGVVSPESGLFETELSYDPPATIYPFPLAEGDTFTSDTVVTGLTLGVVTYATEGYASEVDARGRLTTPFGTFDVLRVRTTLTRTVGFIDTIIHQTAFVSPCFGTVALVVSDAAEDDQGKTQASEIRRLAP